MPPSPARAPRAMQPSADPAEAQHEEEQRAATSPRRPRSPRRRRSRGRCSTTNATPTSAWNAGMQQVGDEVEPHEPRPVEPSHARRGVPSPGGCPAPSACAGAAAARKPGSPCWSTLVRASATPRQPASSRRRPRSWSSVSRSRHGPPASVVGDRVERRQPVELAVPAHAGGAVAASVRPGRAGRRSRTRRPGTRSAGASGCRCARAPAGRRRARRRSAAATTAGAPGRAGRRRRRRRRSPARAASRPSGRRESSSSRRRQAALSAAALPWRASGGSRRSTSSSGLSIAVEHARPSRRSSRRRSRARPCSRASTASRRSTLSAIVTASFERRHEEHPEERVGRRRRRASGAATQRAPRERRTATVVQSEHDDDEHEGDVEEHLRPDGRPCERQRHGDQRPTQRSCSSLRSGCTPRSLDGRREHPERIARGLEHAPGARTPGPKRAGAGADAGQILERGDDALGRATVAVRVVRGIERVRRGIGEHRVAAAATMRSRVGADEAAACPRRRPRRARCCRARPARARRARAPPPGSRPSRSAIERRAGHQARELRVGERLGQHDVRAVRRAARRARCRTSGFGWSGTTKRTSRMRRRRAGRPPRRSARGRRSSSRAGAP